MAVHATAALPHVDDVLATGQICNLWHGLSRRQRVDAALATQSAHISGHMRRVALLAQHGRTGFKHARYGAAVRVVASTAIFSHRVVLLHKRTALFRVAGVTSVVDTVALDQLGTR